MRRYMNILLLLCVGLTFSVDADARRFGGGRSFGAMPSHPMRQSAPPPAPHATPPIAGRPAGAGGMSRWLGPLAGFAAGGLLASMFMGGGFHGIQLFDVLIIGVLGFLAFRFFASRRASQPQLASAGGAYQRNTSGEAVGQPPPPPIFGGSSLAAAPPVINAPAWFNEQAFVSAAREHFESLQQHWDANEMNKIGEFVTPQMLQFLNQERASLGDGFQSTYINDLDVQLDGVDDGAEKTVATLTFRGISKTSRFDQGEAFSESWNMERAHGDNRPWLVAGIRQNS